MKPHPEDDSKLLALALASLAVFLCAAIWFILYVPFR